MKLNKSIFLIFCMLFISSCSEKPKSQSDLVIQKQKQCNEKIMMKSLIDTKEWNDVYKVFQISKENQLKDSEILELADMGLQMMSAMGQGIIGVSLEDNSLELKSIYALPHLSYQQYIVKLKDDGISYKFSKGLRENSTLEYLAQGDSEFQDLCADSPKKYIDIAKLVINRSAMELFGAELKETGVL